MIELKPCPFCGEKPDDYIRAIGNVNAAQLHLYIICCNCEMNGSIIKRSIEIPSGSPYERLIEAHEKLIKDWNTRVGE